MPIINSVISTGKTPTGTKTITSNGVVDIADFASADVQVPTTAPAHYIEKTVDANDKLVNHANFIDLNNVKDLGDYVLYYAYSNSSFPSGTTIDLSSLIKLTGEGCMNNTFRLSTGISGVEINNLKYITGRSALEMTFVGNGLTTITFDKLFYVGGGSCFNRTLWSCSNLTSVDFGHLIETRGNTVFNETFMNCSKLTDVDVSSLSKITNYGCFYRTFNGCTSFSDLRFPSVTESSFGTQTGQFDSMLYSCTGVTVHFPKNLDPQSGSTVISSLSNYPNFGGTNTTILFDLPSTNHLIGTNTQEYERNPKYDTSTAIAWRIIDTGSGINLVVDWTPYYTSGTTDPQVGDTIYTDSACTTALATISSIA